MRHLPLTPTCTAVLLAVSTASAQYAAPLHARDFTPGSAEPLPPEPHHDPTVVVGTLMFTLPYLVGVGYAATVHDRPAGMEPSALYVPVFGPALAIRGVGCDFSGDSSCSDESPQGVWALLLLDTIVQATGVAVLTVGLLNTGDGDMATRVRVAPYLSRSRTYGLTATADF